MSWFGKPAWAGLLLLVAGCSDPAAPRKSDHRPTPATPGEDTTLVPLRGSPVPARWSVRPRFPPPGQALQGLRALPDGDLAEWVGSTIHWDRNARPVGRPAGYSGRKDLEAWVGLASYGSGLSLAVLARDDSHQPARAASALEGSDHVEIELWPGAKVTPHTGLHLRLGTSRQLINVLRPEGEPWRETSISATGAALGAGGSGPGGSGYQVEVRIPLSTLTPLPGPRVDAVRYRVTIHDADRDEKEAIPTLRIEGVARLTPSMDLPEAVQKRSSVRICLATQKGALWGYENGWRCAIPVELDAPSPDDTASVSAVAFGYARVPTPPRIVWIRERLLFVNFTSVDRGVAALLDGKDTILSVMPLGVVAAEDPGNPRVKDSGAETLKLPDGTWAVAATHAFPAQPGPLGGRCAGGHRVYLSILALRGCLKSTPHAPAPDPPFTPYLERVFQVLLEDCDSSAANDWSLSRDRRTIKVHSSLYPARPPTVWVFRDGRYRRQETRSPARTGGAGKTE